MLDQIELFIARKPFEPFVIRTSDGREYPVLTPDHVDIPPNRFSVAVYDDRSALTFLPLRQISGVTGKVPDHS